MNRKQAAAGALLLAGLLAYQPLVMDRMPEKKLEDRLTQVVDLPASSAVPTYLAALFLGPFRVVALDLIWIELKNLREDNRFFEAQQLMELISWLEPRNPEVWAMLGWDASYNIPEGGMRDPEERWKWIRFGLVKFQEGSRHNPDTPILNFELGFRLWHRMTMTRLAFLDMELIHRIEQDDELQRLLRPPGATLAGRLSPFRLSIQWLEAARNQVEAIPTDERFPFFITKTGLYLHPDTMDGYIRTALYFEAIYQWRAGNFAAAKEAFAKAAEQARLMRRKYGERASNINDIMAVFYDRLPAAVDAYARLSAAPPEDKKAAREELVRAAESALKEAGTFIDEGHIHALVSIHKQKLASDAQGADDAFEFNDMPTYASPTTEGQGLFATIAPFLSDTDCYEFPMPLPPHPEGAPHRDPFIPRTLTIAVSSKGEVPLRVKFLSPAQAVIAEEAVPPGERRELKVRALQPGSHLLLVEAASPSDAPAPPSRYYLQWLSTEPPLPK